MADYSSGALAARIYSFVQKPVPSDAERKAAYAAWDLLCKTVPEMAAATAEAGARTIKNMAEQYMKLNPRTEPISDMGQMEAMRLQDVMQKRSQTIQMLSSILKKQSETSQSIISNI